MSVDVARGDILIIDDSATNRMHLSKILQKAGYQVAELDSGKTALQFIQKHPPDLVLLDINMPNPDGYEVCRKLKNEPLLSNIPVLFISGLSKEKDKVKGFEVGAIDYITKPFQEKEVLARIHSHLMSSRMERGLKSMVDERTSKLILEQERFKSVFDLASDAFFIIDAEGDIVDVNHQACQTLGYSPEEFRSLRLEDIEVGASMTQLLNVMETVGDKQHVITEGVHKRKDGSTFPVEVSIGVLQKSVPKLALAIARNTTERKQAQEALRNEKEFAEAVINSQMDSLFIVEPSGKAILWNRVFKEMTGYSDEEISTMTAPLSYLDPADHERAMAFVDTVLKQGSGKIELDIVCKDNRRVPTEYSVVLLEKGRNESQCLIAVGRDLTDRKRLEEQARQSTKMEAIGHLAGGIAHDFNNIIAGIMGLAELSLHNTTPESSSGLRLQKILNACERAEHLVKQILAFSRQQKDKKNPVHLAPVVLEAVQLLQASLPASIEISTQISPKNHPVMADSTKIHEVVMNLCTNAAHAMGEKGLLEITLGEKEIERELKGEIGSIRPGRYSVLEISDTGCGIEGDVLEHIFEPFFTTNQVGNGTGMGLAVVFGIMQAHDGNIVVNSTPGRGTTFRVFFPITDKSVKKKKIPESFHRIQKGNERVLFIDDEATIMETVSQMLVHLGYEVTTFNDSLLALEAFEKQPDAFDFVLTDQSMPSMTGLELAEKMLQIQPQLPIIVCTGYNKKIEEEISNSQTRINVIMKPFRLHEIAAKIREVLDYR